MKTKISAVFLTLLMLLSIFSACTQEPSTAIQQSDKDSAKIKDHFIHISAQHTLAETAPKISTYDELFNKLSDSDTDAIYYKGNEDIKISSDKAITKLLAIETTGNISLDATASSVIVYDAGEAITVNAAADSLIVSADDVSVDVNHQTGIVYAEGQNVTVNIKNSATDMVFARNTAVTINNITDEEITVMLINGVKVIVPAKTTYSVRDNTLQKYKSAK